MSIASEISQLNTNKTNIKAAIVGKNPVISPTDNLSQWPTSIGSIVELKGETKTVTPTTSLQTITPSSGKNGIILVTVDPVTSGIDANIIASNIKKDVVILGITGDYEGSGGGGSVQGYRLTTYRVPYQGEWNRSCPNVLCHKSDGTTYTIPEGVGGSCDDVVYAEIPNSNIYDDELYLSTGYIKYASNSNGYFNLNLTSDISVGFGHDGCFLKGTLITLADNSEKLVEDITFDDELLVWDFDNGCFSKEKPIWIKKAQTTDYWFLNKYKSGKVLKTTGRSETGWGHRTFDMNKNKFIYTTESVSDNIFTLDGIDIHMQCERKEEPCEFYNIITAKHFNLFANRILTSCSLNNLYPIKDMKFVKDDRALRSISEYDNIQLEWFDGLRLAENNSDINKLNSYVKNLIETNIK